MAIDAYPSARIEERQPGSWSPESAEGDGAIELPLYEERRRSSRLTFRAEARVGLGPWCRQRWMAGRVDNLSSSGLALRLPRSAGRAHPAGGEMPLAIGTRVRVHLEIPPLGEARQSTPSTVEGTVAWSRWDPDTAELVCGLRLPKLIHEWVEHTNAAWHRKAFLAAATLLGLLIVAVKGYNVLWFWYEPWFQLYSLIVTTYLCSRTILSLVYRPPQDRGFLPSVSLIIAAKNEEAHIAGTIAHGFRLHYPLHLFEVLVIDDGSTDQTWARLTALCDSYPRLRIFRFPENRGKRHAMALGAQEASGQILVYIDSDSFVEPEGVYRIVQAFADPRIGAVAGHTRVIVEPNNPISKMESVRYFISHRVMKSAESVVGCVTCCPGAFSAYRRSAMLAVLPKWLNQTFFGTIATFGDDRSLTNFILRTHKVIFCDTARCWTYVPDTWSKYFRQQLRWKKSWMRETLIASRILAHKPPLAALSFYAAILLTLCAPVMVVRNLIIFPLVYSMSCLPYLTGVALVYLFFCLIYLYFTRADHWYYGMAFAGLYIGVLCWQNYYAMATVSRTHWGTR
ncbi:MAG: glycosyltransferase [Candidatus Omnitrophica bacterium]|nr:glycosyltransferase [Candidatus Omnitrophota bacterium]